MLEILCLIAFTRRIGRVLSRKGRASGWHKAGAVALWFVGEFGGAFFGAIIVNLLGLSQVFIYLAALGGALVGAGIVYALAALAEPAPTLTPRVEDEGALSSYRARRSGST